MYDNSTIGEKSTSILYNSINRHAGISHKNRRHGKLGLQLNFLGVFVFGIANVRII